MRWVEARDSVYSCYKHTDTTTGYGKSITWMQIAICSVNVFLVNFGSIKMKIQNGLSDYCWPHVSVHRGSYVDLRSEWMCHVSFHECS